MGFKPTQIVEKLWTDGGAITLSSSITTGPTKGTTAVDKQWYRRVGNTCEMEIYYNQTGVGSEASADGGSLLFTLPAGMEFDTDFGALPSSAIEYKQSVGWGQIFAGTANVYHHADCYPYNSTQFFVVLQQINATAGDNYGSWKCNVGVFNKATVYLILHLRFPLKGY
jgi:hypothetical protein